MASALNGHAASVKSPCDVGTYGLQLWDRGVASLQYSDGIMVTHDCRRYLVAIDGASQIATPMWYRA